MIKKQLFNLYVIEKKSTRTKGIMAFVHLFDETFKINQSGRITFGNPDVPLNISGYTPSGQLGHCGMDNNFVWSCSAG